MHEDTLDIRLLNEPLDLAAAIGLVAMPGVGGINLFIGVTRGQIHPEAGALTRLDYHAFPDMALKEIARIAAEARARWPILRAVVWHRLGAVAIGEASVVIAVGTAHRDSAFCACRFLIDELKRRAPIWKKDIYSAQGHWQSES
jgi:molybdopterin synthase catalytic subunit